MCLMNEMLQQKANVEWATQMTKNWAHQKTTCLVGLSSGLSLEE
jgi:hypothetical protein